VSMGASGREQTVQNVVLIRRDGLEQRCVCTAAQLLGGGGGRPQITESLRLHDKAFDSTALASVSEPPSSRGGVHQSRQGRSTTNLL